jgi:hypothetical protein
MATTYEKIQSTTLGSATAAITFSSISSAYTDLRLVIVSASSETYYLLFNNDTTATYSLTQIYGSGSSASSSRRTAQTKIFIGDDVGLSTDLNPKYMGVDIFSYAGSTYKTCLVDYADDQNGTGGVWRKVALWRNTTALNRIDIKTDSGNLATGTTATLYGILKA